jgi:hypothetical protein
MVIDVYMDIGSRWVAASVERRDFINIQRSLVKFNLGLNNFSE